MVELPKRALNNTSITKGNPSVKNTATGIRQNDTS